MISRKFKIIYSFTVVVLLLISTSTSFSQNGDPGNNLGLRAEEVSSVLFNPNDISKIPGIALEWDNIRFGKAPTDGSVFLFDQWENDGVIVVGDNHFVVKNINFNIRQDIIASQIGSDSTFIYHFKGVKEIIINNRHFKEIIDIENGIKKIYEVIHEHSNFKILRGHSVKVVYSSPNPMLNRRGNRIIKKSNLYLYLGKEIIEINLKKSKVLDLFKKDIHDELTTYIKQNKLSYKKEADVISILKAFAGSFEMENINY